MLIKVSISDKIGCSEMGNQLQPTICGHNYLTSVRFAQKSFSGQLFSFHFCTPTLGRNWMAVHGNQKYSITVEKLTFGVFPQLNIRNGKGKLLKFALCRCYPLSFLVCSRCLVLGYPSLSCIECSEIKVSTI